MAVSSNRYRLCLNICFNSAFLCRIVAAVNNPTWTLRPSDHVYAVKGKPVLLYWSYDYEGHYFQFKKWYRCDKNQKQIGPAIVTQVSGNSPIISDSAYKGRVDIIGNGGIRITDLSVNDEGCIAVEITFDNGMNLEDRMQLNVTSKCFRTLHFFANILLHVTPTLPLMPAASSFQFTLTLVGLIMRT